MTKNHAVKLRAVAKSRSYFHQNRILLFYDIIKMTITFSTFNFTNTLQFVYFATFFRKTSKCLSLMRPVIFIVLVLLVLCVGVFIAL